MTARLDIGRVSLGIFGAMDGLERYLHGCGLEPALIEFDGKALADLTLAVATINAWNRLAIAGRSVPGTYQPAAAGA